MPRSGNTANTVSGIVRIPSHGGTGPVLQMTRDRLKKLGRKWQELPEHQDIDRPEDLDHLSLIPELSEYSSCNF